MDLNRLSRWEKISGASAVVLFLSMFAPWYSLQEKGITSGSSAFEEDAPGISAWEAFAGIDVLLLIACVGVAGLMLAKATSREVALPAPPSVLVAAAGALVVLLVGFRLVSPPDVGAVQGLLDRAGLEFTPFFAYFGLVAGGLIAFGGWRLMGEQGTSLNEQVELARSRFGGGSAGSGAAAAPAGGLVTQPHQASPPPLAAVHEGQQGTPVAAARPAGEDPVAEQRVRRMSWVMLGCGAALVVGSALPWVSGSAASVSGLSVWQGWAFVVLGVGLGLYAYQGLNAKNDRMRNHGWATAAVAIAVLWGFALSGSVDDLADAGADVSTGAGLWIVILGALGAIWPLVVLRRESKRREGGDLSSGQLVHQK